MLHRPRRSVVYRSGKQNDEADRKLYRDRAVDCVAILNVNGWYEDRDVPVDCLEMVRHARKSYKTLSQDKWYAENFDNICGELVSQNGSKHIVKGWVGVGLDRDNRVVCVPPGTINEDASVSIIRHAMMHTTLFKAHVGKKRAEKLGSYAAKALEAKTPKDFLRVVRDMVRDFGKVLGKAFNFSGASRTLVSFMILFVVAAHLINVEDHKSYSLSPDHYIVHIPRWGVELFDWSGTTSRGAADLLVPTLRGMHEWVDANIPGYNSLTTIGWNTTTAMMRVVQYLLQSTARSVEKAAGNIGRMQPRNDFFDFGHL